MRSWFRRLWNNPGPDQGWSWVILVTNWLFLALTIGFSTTGSIGIIFIEFSTVFNASRKNAAWPFSIFGIAQCFGGLLSGIITHYFDLRNVIISCAILCASSMVLSFWGNDLVWMSLSFGLFFGAAVGVIWTAGLVFIHHYFKKYLATAMGILVTALPVAGMFLPYLVNFLINHYGVRGALLLYGGLIMQLLLMFPLLRLRTSQHFPQLGRRQVTLLEKNLEAETKQDQVPKEVSPSSRIRRFTQGLRLYRTVVTTPMFYVITFQVLMAMNVLVGLSMTLVDFALDSGLSKDEGVLLVTAFAFADVFGRVVAGLIADRGWIGRDRLSIINMFVMAASLALIGVFQNLAWIMVFTLIAGITEGSVISITNVLYPKYVGAANLSTALGLRICFAGILAFVRPLLIGYLKDTFQTNIYFYYIMGSLSMLAGSMWCIRPCFIEKDFKIRNETVEPNETDVT